MVQPGAAPPNDLNVIGSRPLSNTFGPDWFALLGGTNSPILDLGNSFLDPNDTRAVPRMRRATANSLQNPDIPSILRLSAAVGGQGVPALGSAIGNPSVFLARDRIEPAAGSIESQLSQFWRNAPGNNVSPQRYPSTHPTLVPIHRSNVEPPYRPNVDPNPQCGLRNDPVTTNVLPGTQSMPRPNSPDKPVPNFLIETVVQTLEVFAKDLANLKEENATLKNQVDDLSTRLESLEGSVKRQQRDSLSPLEPLRFAQADEAVIRNFEQHGDMDSLWIKSSNEAGYLGQEGLYLTDPNVSITELEQPIRNRVRALSDDITTQKRHQEVCEFLDGILGEEPHRVDNFHLKRSNDEQLGLLGVPVLREVGATNQNGTAYSPKATQHQEMAPRLIPGAPLRPNVPNHTSDTWYETFVDHPTAKNSQKAKELQSKPSLPNQESGRASLTRHLPVQTTNGVVGTNYSAVVGDYDLVRNFFLWQIGNISEIRGNLLSQTDCIVSPPFDFKDIQGKLRIRLQPVGDDHGTQQSSNGDVTVGGASLKTGPQNVDVNNGEDSLKTDKLEGQGSTQESSWLKNPFGLHMSISVPGSDVLVKLSMIAGDKVSEPQWHKFGSNAQLGNSTYSRLVTGGPWAGGNKHFATYEECVDVPRDVIPLGVAILDVIQADQNNIGSHPDFSGQSADPSADVTASVHVCKDRDNAAVEVVRQVYRHLAKGTMPNNDTQPAHRVARNRCHVESEAAQSQPWFQGVAEQC
eukprot:Selendium_serpulae@DN6155_c0_g4_i1.p1